MKNISIIVCFLIGLSNAYAQEVNVIDHKGTKNIVNNNSVTTALTAPTAPLEGDVWFDTTTNTTKIWDADAIAWKRIDSWLGYKTIHHMVGTTLAITDVLHNNTDIHIESTGEVSLASTAVNDGTNFYITNTTGIARALSFTGFAGAFLRNGGAVTDVKGGTGLVLKANTRYLCHVTKNGTNFYFNATEAGGSGDIVPLWKSDTGGGDYNPKDIVNYNGVLYKNKIGDNTNTSPNSDTTNWEVTDAYLGNKTIHHADLSVPLAITHVDHNNVDIHIESTAELTITDTDVTDGTNFYITNTTGADRSITFSGFTGAFLRNGGAVTNAVTGGLTLKANTRYLCHVTDNSGFYFNATEAGSAGKSYEVYNEKSTKETLTNLVAAGNLQATFTMALSDGDVNATAITTSSFNGSYGLINSFNGTDHATAGQLTETITITFDREFVLSKLRGTGRVAYANEFFKDLELQLYDAANVLISTTNTSVTSTTEYFEFTPNKRIKKLVIVGSNSNVGTNSGINNFEFFTAEKQIDYTVIPAVPEIATDGDIIRLDSEEGTDRVVVSDPTISEIIIPNFESFDATRFDLINVTQLANGGPETLFDGVLNLGTAAFHASSTTTTADYGVGYRFKSYYKIKKIRIQASSAFARSGAGTVRVYDKGEYVYGSNVLTAATVAGGWIEIDVLPSTQGIKGDEVQFLYENGAVNGAGDRVINISEFQILGAYPETLSVNGGVSIKGDLRVGERLIFTKIDLLRVGINHANPAEALHVFGNIKATVGSFLGSHIGSSSLSSDRRLKESITPLDNSLGKLLSLRGVNYYWKDKTVSEVLQIGVIAQEIETVFPELVLEGEEYKSVNYVGLIPVLLEAIKEQQAQLEVKETAINDLKLRIAQIEEALGME